MLIGLMDCNNFFVSCERLFRPDLARRPVAVLSSNDGCVVARSQEVKDLGILMGVPYFKVRELCEKENVTFFSSNFTLYRDISARVMQLLREEVDACQLYSIDEAFFTVPDTIDPKRLHTIRDRILREVGIPVSIGVGKTKTIAKCAGDVAKRESGVHVFDDEAWVRAAEEISCGTVWGIGRQTSAKLRELGIEDARAFMELDRAFVEKTFGVGGVRLQMELKGTSVNPVSNDESELQKSITSTRSFARETTDLTVLESAITHHLTHVAEKLRARGVCAGRIAVVAQPNRFGDYALRRSTRDAVLTVPSDDTTTLLTEALRLLRELHEPGVPYKKAGVLLGDITPRAAISQSLFNTDTTHEERSTLDEVTDMLNARFGTRAVQRGTLRGGGQWAASAALRSQEYTTRWGSIRTVKAL